MRKFIVVLAAAVLSVPRFASADVTSDHPAAILIFPRVLASSFLESDGSVERDTVDTVVQISNTSNAAVSLHCFYVDATSLCSGSGKGCGLPFAQGCSLEGESCDPQWRETDFDVILTPRQPLAWSVTHGLQRAERPLPGNAGTLIPPVALHPVDVLEAELSVFQGELKCIVVDDQGHGAAQNVVKGEATLVGVLNHLDTESENQFVRSNKYNGIGILAKDGDANGDDVLELGGDANEYNGCANVLIAQHFFDRASVSGDFGPVTSELTLVPCTQDFRIQVPGSTTAQFLVFNEFEQRFSTSARVDCVYRKQLSRIDTQQPDRSIFFIGVAGTLAGQTRIRGVSEGLIGVLTEQYGEGVAGESPGDASFNLGMQGDREAADRITLP